MERHISRSEAETLAIAAEFAATLRPGDVVALTGDLGAGKTVFTRGVATALGIAGDRTATGVRLMQRTMGAISGGRLEVVRDSFDPTNLCQVTIFNDLLAGFMAEIGW
jgi:ABC-type glutathione transport system ATPase component